MHNKKLSDCISSKVSLKKIEHLREVVRDDKNALKRKRGIFNLDLYLDEKGLRRVWGRLKKSNLLVSDVNSILIGKYGNFPRFCESGVIKKWPMGEEGLT